MKRSSKIILTSIAVIGISAATIGVVSAKGPCGGYRNQMGFEDTGATIVINTGTVEPGRGQQGSRGQHGGGWSKGPGYGADFEAKMDERLDRVKSQLGITSTQEPAWNEFTSHLKQKMETRKQRRKARMSDAIPAVEQRIEFMREKSAQINEMADAMAKLHAQLTPEQQKMADSLPMGRMGRKGPPM